MDRVFFSARSSEKPLLHVHRVLAEALLLIITILGPNFLVLSLLGNFLALKTEGKGSLDNTNQFLISEKWHICQFCFHWLDQSKLHNILSSLSVGCTTVYTKKVFQAVWWRETESECDLCRGVKNLDLTKHQFNSVQSLSRVRLFATPWIIACQASMSITNSRSLLKLMSIESVMPSSHLILCRPLLLLSPNPSQHQSVFQWVNSSHEVAKVSIGVSASVSVLPTNTQGWSPLGWTGWIFLQSKGLSRVFSNTTVQKHQFFGTQLSSQTNSHIVVGK